MVSPLNEFLDEFSNVQTNLICIYNLDVDKQEISLRNESSDVELVLIFPSQHTHNEDI